MSNWRLSTKLIILLLNNLETNLNKTNKSNHNTLSQYYFHSKRFWAVRGAQFQNNHQLLILEKQYTVSKHQFVLSSPPPWVHFKPLGLIGTTLICHD